MRIYLIVTPMPVEEEGGRMVSGMEDDAVEFALVLTDLVAVDETEFMVP